MLTKRTTYDNINKLSARAVSEKRVPCKLNNVKQHTKHQIRFFLNLDAFGNERTKSILDSLDKRQ